MNKRDEKIALQSKAFNLFEEGKVPVELVQEGICTKEEAKELFMSYQELLKCEVDKEVFNEKLSTQLGLIGSRLAQIELKIMNSIFLPKSRECKNCDHTGIYGVGVVCQQCGSVEVHVPMEIGENIVENIGFTPFKDEEED